MAFHQPQIHVPVPKLLPVTANRIVIPFHPLLKQTAAALHFPDPLYHILDASTNSAYVLVETDIPISSTENFTLTYVGGRADTIEESCEIAATKAVRNLIQKWGVQVEDLTFEKYRTLERCSRLYGLKRKELTRIVRGEESGDLEEHVPPENTRVRNVFVDYMPLLKKIFGAITIQCTPLESVKHCTGRYTSWIQLQPLFNNVSPEFFIGTSCDTLSWAKSYLAKKVIMYLIPAYNLDIVDANYESYDLKYAAMHCNLEQESCFSIRGKMSGVQAEPVFSCLLIEKDEMAAKNALAHIPVVTPPVKAKPQGTMRLTSPPNIIYCHAGYPNPIAYKVPPQEGTCSKRARNA